MRKHLLLALVLAILATLLLAGLAAAQEPGYEFQPTGYGATVNWPDYSITTWGNVVVSYTSRDHFRVEAKADGTYLYNGYVRVVPANATDPVTGQWLYQVYSPGWMPGYHVP